MEKLLELLKNKFSGVRQDALAQLAASLALVATTEEEQTATVEKLTSAQVEAFVKDYRKTVDKEVSDGTKTFEENLKKKYDFVEKGKQEPPTKTTPPAPATDDSDERFKAMQQKIEELTGAINGMKQEGQSKARSAKYGEILGTCKDENLKAILERQLPLLQSLDDTAFETELTTLKGDVEKANQLFAERSLPTSVQTKKVIDEKQVSPALKTFVEKLNGKTEQE
ncbi:MAG: hypothetical protein K6G25_06520 [Bacteroidales bacterium]|nr:hypothetical protein [Bacteroidales bacterium]